jgi:hypothetical protein
LDRREIWLRELAADKVSCHFVITCRSHEYLGSPDWQVVRVLDMDQDQTDSFIALYSKPDAARALKQELAENSALAAVAGNPFFLCTIVATYRPGINLSSRGAILNALLNMLLQAADERGHIIATSDIDEVSVKAHQMIARGMIGDRFAIPRALPIRPSRKPRLSASGCSLIAVARCSSATKLFRNISLPAHSMRGSFGVL